MAIEACAGPLTAGLNFPSGSADNYSYMGSFNDHICFNVVRSFFKVWTLSLAYTLFDFVGTLGNDPYYELIFYACWIK